MATGFPETACYMAYMHLESGERAAHGRQALCRRSVPPYAIFSLESAAGHMRYIFL